MFKSKRDLLSHSLSRCSYGNKTMPLKFDLNLDYKEINGSQTQVYKNINSSEFPGNSSKVNDLKAIFDDNKTLDLLVKSSQKGLLNKAMDIITKRKEDSQNNPQEKKEHVFGTVEKANDLFVIELTTKMINEEIERLKQLEIEKKQTIKNLEKAKENEFLKFRENLERIKKITQQTNDQATEVTQKKMYYIKEIKTQSQIQAILKNETKKLEDLADSYSELQEFLTVISPDYFREKKIKTWFSKQHFSKKSN